MHLRKDPALNDRLHLATKSLKTCLLIGAVLSASLLVYSLLAGLLPLYGEKIRLPPLGRPVLAACLALVLLTCLRGLTLLDRLGSQVIRDGLTGLVGRDYARQRLKEEYYRAKRYEQPLSLLMIDLDSFRPPNDRFGRAAGDHLLKYFAGLVLGTVRPSDVAARFDGGEFLIILPNTGPHEAQAVAERLRRRIAESPFRIDAGREDVRLTVSIGASSMSFPEYGQDAEELITMADLALYQVKKDGRNAVSAGSAN